MKRVLFTALLFSFALEAAEVSDVRSVYILPMYRGLDQYIANRLTNLHVFQVVTDPQKADAVITDRIGAALEDRLQELYPPPKPEAAPEPEEKSLEKEKAVEKSKDKETPASKASETKASESKASETKTYGAPPPGTMSSFGRARGTVFLVDVKSREVLWSTYQQPKDMRSKQLDRTALNIAQELKRVLDGK